MTNKPTDKEVKHAIHCVDRAIKKLDDYGMYTQDGARGEKSRKKLQDDIDVYEVIKYGLNALLEETNENES